MARNDYSTIRIRPGVVEDLRRLVRRISAEADQDVTQSEALGAALAYALDHVPEVAARLARSNPGERGAPVPPSEPGAPPSDPDGGTRS